MGKGEGKGEGCCCCGGNFEPAVGDKNAQVLEGESGLWLPCEIKEVNSLGACAGKEWVVDYVPSGGQGLNSVTVPKEKLREIESALRLGPDGEPDLDRDRGCSDCPCILLFMIFAAGWVVLAVVALDKGEPKRLLMPNDFRDQICGDKAPREHYPLWFVPKPQFKLTYGVCAARCPDPGDIICNNDWEFQHIFEASGLAWFEYDPTWGRNNKEFQMNASEVLEFNALLPGSITPSFGSGVTGTIATVTTQWPNIPMNLLDPMGAATNCAWREEAFGAFSTAASRAIGKLKFRKATPCTVREASLIARALETQYRVDSFNCFSVIYRSNSMVKRCVPFSNDREQSSAAASKLKALAKSTSAGRYLTDGFAEVKASWRVLVISAFTAIIISFIWLILVRVLLKPIVYFILLLILAVLVAAGLACHFYANSLEDVTLPGDDSHDRQVITWRVFSYIFWVAAVVYMVLMCWLLNRIRIAIAVLEQASMALFSSPSVLIIPPLMFVFIVGWIVWFVVLAVHIQTVQDVTVQSFKDVTVPIYNDVTGAIVSGLGNASDAVGVYVDSTALKDTMDMASANASNSSALDGAQLTDSDVIIRYMHLYNLFGFLWTVQIFIAMAFFVISGVVIMWFWSASTAEIASGEKSKSTVPFAMKNAFYRMLRYHLGTLIFGALLIAIIQFVRCLLLYIERQIPEEVRESASFKVLKCLIHCFLAYMERLVKIINKNAFIITGIFGWNFCRSAAKALMFMIANIARVAVLTAMGEVVMFLLKIFICAANVYVAMLLLEKKELTDDEVIESGLFPLFCVLCITFVISVIVMNCYDTCITTVFMCSLVDEDRAGDCGDSYVPYVPPSLAKLMDNFKEVSALEADYKAKMKHATALKKNGDSTGPAPKKHQVAPSQPAVAAASKADAGEQEGES